MCDYINAHKHCSNHKQQLLRDKRCGCFYCLSIFAPSEIEMWIDDNEGTAICPYCGVDAVIGESSGFAVEKDFLIKMREYWFK